MPPFYKQPIYVVGLVVVGIAAYIMTQPDEAPKKAATVKKTTTTSKTASLFTDQDYKVKFTPISASAKDVFKPLVARQAAPTIAPGGADGLSAALAGGESGWVYSGRAVVDGVPTALLENQTSGEVNFLKRGQRWKTCEVVDIKPDLITLRGPDGTPVVVKTKDPNATATASTPAATNPVAVTAPLAGDIGAPVTVAPQPGGRRRGRRNQTDNGNTNAN